MTVPLPKPVPDEDAARAGMPPPAPAAPEAGTLFQQRWWLEAAAPAALEWAEVRWDGQVVAALPFVRRRRAGLVSLGMPDYTRTLGAVFTPPASKPAQRQANLRRLARALIEALPRHDRLFQVLDPADESAFAFSLAGCSIGQFFTFRIGAATPLPSVWENIDGRTRRLIRAGEKTLTVERHGDLDRFRRISLAHYPKGENAHDFAALHRLFAACRARGRGEILAVLDAEGREIASVVLIWDERMLYYWLPAAARDLASGGTNAFLVWEAAKRAAALGLGFDLDGYDTGRSAKVLASFGLTPVARPGLVHANGMGRVAQALIDLRRARRLRAPETHDTRGENG